MKSYSINISKYHSVYHLMNQPVREKRHVDLLLLETLRTFIIGDIEASSNVGNITLKIDKMNRFIYELENKIFSINCPFTCLKKDNKYVFKDATLDIEIDSKLISALSTIIKMGKIDNFEKLLEEIIDINEYDFAQVVWEILKKIYNIEYGYLRYEYDEEREDGCLHPLNHLDINFTNSNQYKIGLNKRITVEEFTDILDVSTQCYYLWKKK